MIYEFRTYTLKVRTLGEFVKRFGDALPKRLELSPLAAFWHTELGRLNQVIHVWSYKDANERARVRAEAVKLGVWPPSVSEFITDMRSEIMVPLPFSPKLEPSNHGPFFEMRSYVLRPGGVPEMAAKWEEHLPGRLAVAPDRCVHVRCRWAQPVGSHLGLQKLRAAHGGPQNDAGEGHLAAAAAGPDADPGSEPDVCSAVFPDPISRLPT
ncbi:MAG: NIPSNAP family protein [Hyphomicrobiaceae bacterium]